MGGTVAYLRCASEHTVTQTNVRWVSILAIDSSITDQITDHLNVFSYPSMTTMSASCQQPPPEFWCQLWVMKTESIQTKTTAQIVAMQKMWLHCWVNAGSVALIWCYVWHSGLCSMILTFSLIYQVYVYIYMEFSIGTAPKWWSNPLLVLAQVVAPGASRHASMRIPDVSWGPSLRL